MDYRLSIGVDHVQQTAWARIQLLNEGQPVVNSVHHVPLTVTDNLVDELDPGTLGPHPEHGIPPANGAHNPSPILAGGGNPNFHPPGPFFHFSSGSSSDTTPAYMQTPSDAGQDTASSTAHRQPPRSLATSRRNNPPSHAEPQPRRSERIAKSPKKQYRA